MICSSGVGFDPLVDGERLLFGFHGIWQGTAVLYDRKHQSQWLHLTGECIEGRFEGRVLTSVPGRHVLWSEWKRDHPTTRVMAPHPRLASQYFTRRDAKRGNDFFPPMFPGTIKDVDQRLPLAELIYGITTADGARAYPIRRLKEHDSAPFVMDHVGKTPVLLFFDRSTGSVSGYGRILDGEVREFEVDGELVRDTRSLSHFNADGFAVDGLLRGRRLAPIFGVQAEWYGWFAAHPDTSIWGDD